MVLNKNIEVFVIYVTTLILKIIIHLVKELWIILLITKNVTVPGKYLNYFDIFSKNSVTKLIKQTKLNKYAINLIKDKQSPYRPIYSLRPVKQKILKTYIETKLVNSFIRPLKSIADISILFI